MTKFKKQTLDHIGEKRNKLKILGVIRDKKETKFNCLCDCGNIKYINSSSVLNNDTISCGCSRRRKHFLPGIRARKRLISSYKENAQKRNLLYLLKDEEIIKLFEGKCHYCGTLPYNTTKYISRHRKYDSQYTYNGIDRKNNKLGYTTENSVSCCKLCNYAKGTIEYTEFIELIKKIYKNLNRGDIQ